MLLDNRAKRLVNAVTGKVEIGPKLLVRLRESGVERQVTVSIAEIITFRFDATLMEPCGLSALGVVPRLWNQACR